MCLEILSSNRKRIVCFYFEITSADSRNFPFSVESYPESLRSFKCYFQTFDLNCKVFHLFDKTILADKNIEIIEEESAQNPSRFSYFINICGQRLVEISPNSANNRYEINIGPIGKLKLFDF